MIPTEETEKYRTCSQLLDEGKYQEALDLAESITFSLYRAAIFIDAGFASDKPGKVREGTETFENLLASNQAEQHFKKPSLLYNAANGRSALYQIKVQRKKRVSPVNDTDLRTAKKLYREALSALGEERGAFKTQVLVNYGNCLSQVGRFIEAIECYQKALEADPTNGMAAGNLGIELEHAAKMTGRYRHEYIALAYDLLIRVFGPDMHLDYGSMPAIQSFQLARKRLQHFIDFHKEPILPPEPFEIRQVGKMQKEYIQFCRDNGLFLNSWVGDKTLSPGITDDVSYGHIVTPVEDNHLVPELFKILNEIKESFTTARYLYFLSQKDSKVLNNISGMTFYYGMDSHEVKSLYTGLCKTAYARAFDVLDKIARIINVYFHIGKRESSFWTLFAEKQSLGQDKTIRFAARKTICETENYGLYALADLCIDYFESEHVDFKTFDLRRNRITHDYLAVKLHVLEEVVDTIGLDELQSETKTVLFLAKYAILYAVSAVSYSERAKQHDIGKVFSFEYLSDRGQPFL